MLALSAVNRRFKFRLRQTKDFKIGIYCLSAKHAALRKRAKTGWLENGLEYGDMSIR